MRNVKDYLHWIIIMSSLAGSSHDVLRAHVAMEDELKRVAHYLHHIKHASNTDEKLYFMKAFFQFLCTNHIRISQHVGFRIFILNQIESIRKMARDRHYAVHPHMKPLIDAICYVEKVIRETPIKGAF